MTDHQVGKAVEELAKKRLAHRGDWLLLPAGERNRALAKARRDVEEVGAIQPFLVPADGLRERLTKPEFLGKLVEAAFEFTDAPPDLTAAVRFERLIDAELSAASPQPEDRGGEEEGWPLSILFARSRKGDPLSRVGPELAKEHEALGDEVRRYVLATPTQLQLSDEDRVRLERIASDIETEGLWLAQADAELLRKLASTPTQQGDRR